MNEPLLKYTVLENKYISNKDVYESVLCDCLNQCPNMIEMVGSEFCLIKEQSNGQSDIRADKSEYEIDFKMMIAESYKEFLDRTAPITVEIVPGVKIYSLPPKLSKKVLLLWNYCKDMTDERLEQFRHQKDMDAKNVVHFFDKVINCPKNILIFMPIYFETIQNVLLNEKQFEIALEELSSSTKYVFDFRSTNQNGYQTFLVYLQKVSNNEIYFVISEFTEQGLRLIDRVNMFSLKTVLQIKEENAIF